MIEKDNSPQITNLNTAHLQAVAFDASERFLLKEKEKLIAQAIWIRKGFWEAVCLIVNSSGKTINNANAEELAEYIKGYNYLHTLGVYIFVDSNELELVKVLEHNFTLLDVKDGLVRLEYKRKSKKS